MTTTFTEVSVGHSNISQLNIVHWVLVKHLVLSLAVDHMHRALEEYCAIVPVGDTSDVSPVSMG